MGWGFNPISVAKKAADYGAGALSTANNLGGKTITAPSKFVGDLLSGDPEAPIGIPQTSDYSALAKKAREEIEGLRQKAVEKEALMQGALLKQSEASMNAIDTQLANIINQTGFITGLQKQAIGAQQAQTGLTRSGMTTSRLGSEDIRKAKTISETTSAAEAQKRAVGESAATAIGDISYKRQQVENQLRAAELSGYKDLEYNKKMQDVSMEFKNFINSLETSAMNKQALYSAIGAIGGLGGIGLGYYMTGNESAPAAANTSGVEGTISGPRR